MRRRILDVLETIGIIVGFTLFYVMFGYGLWYLWSAVMGAKPAW